MRSIGEAQGVQVFAPETAYFSYCNSPYTGHKRATAADIYPEHSTWLGPCYSPCAGKVTQIRRMKMGRSKTFPTADYDYAIGLQPYTNENLLMRILHCEASVEIGDNIECGEIIGKLIRSRYFNYWTGPHYHVEIMEQGNFSRSTMSYPLDVDFASVECTSARGRSEFFCEVHEVTSDYVICLTDDISEAYAGDLCGHPSYSANGRFLGILDGGIPHYEHGCVLTSSQTVYGWESISRVMAWNSIIGTDAEVTQGRLQYRTNDSLKVTLDGSPIRGLSCYIFTQAQKIRGAIPLICIPEQYDSLSGRFHQGDIVELKI